MKKYYFPATDEDMEEIYGSNHVVCLDEAEIRRLSSEWETDVSAQMREATPAEIAEYGTFDSGVPYFAIYEDNGGGVVLFIWDDNEDEFHAFTGWEIAPDGALMGALSELREDPAAYRNWEEWEGDSNSLHAEFEEDPMNNQLVGWRDTETNFLEHIAPEKMGFAARRALGVRDDYLDPEKMTGREVIELISRRIDELSALPEVQEKVLEIAEEKGMEDAGRVFFLLAIATLFGTDYPIG